MELDNPLSILKLFFIIFTHKFCMETAASTPKNGRIFEDDVSKYSSLFLTGTSIRTLPYIKINETMTYRLELEDPTNTNTETETLRKKMEAAKSELITQLRNNTKLKVPWKNDAWLTRFLRARDYDVKETVKLVNNYYQFKEDNRFIYDDLVPSEQKDVFETDIINILARREESGSRIIIARGGKWDPDYPRTNLCKLIVALVEIGAYEPVTQHAGIHFIIDMKDMKMDKFMKISLDAVRKMIDWIMKSVPLKLKGVHIVNQPWWFWSAYKVYEKAVMNDLADILVTHGKNWKSLHKEISRSSLPKDYGGDYDMYSIHVDEWEIFLKSLDQEYKKLDSYGIKRINGEESSNVSYSLHTNEKVIQGKKGGTRTYTFSLAGRMLEKGKVFT